MLNGGIDGHTCPDLIDYSLVPVDVQLSQAENEWIFLQQQTMKFGHHDRRNNNSNLHQNPVRNGPKQKLSLHMIQCDDGDSTNGTGSQQTIQEQIAQNCITTHGTEFMVTSTGRSADDDVNNTQTVTNNLNIKGLKAKANISNLNQNTTNNFMFGTDATTTAPSSGTEDNNVNHNKIT